MSDNLRAGRVGELATRDLLRVDYRKYDTSAHRNYPALRLGADVHGTWLGVPSGEFITAAQPATFKYTDPYVLLVPPHAWWTAMFNAPPRRTEIYCDIATPAIWDAEGVHLVDLDLDVRRRRDTGDVELLDEDEFETHSARYGYPEEARVAAWSAVRFLMEALLDHAEPFGDDYRFWLDQVS